MTKEEEKKYKRDYLRTIILLKEIKFFSDHLFNKKEYDKKQHYGRYAIRRRAA